MKGRGCVGRRWLLWEESMLQGRIRRGGTKGRKYIGNEEEW